LWAQIANLRYRRRHIKDVRVKLIDLFDIDDTLEDVNSYDASLMEKVKTIEALTDEEKKTVFQYCRCFRRKEKIKRCACWSIE
jgi:hypothetical protein